MNAWTVPFDASLINYWPINRHVKDLIAGAHLTSSNPIWEADRFNLALSAVKVTGSTNYYNFPTGVYFAGDFTITAWVKTFGCNSFQRLMDCGNGAGSDNIYFALSNGANCYPYIAIRNGASYTGLHFFYLFYTIFSVIFYVCNLNI